MKPQWVAPRFRCGLGNRLFQTLAAVGTAERLDTECVFFLPRCSHAEHGNYDVVMKLFPDIRIVETANTWIETNETKEFTIPIPETNGKPLVIQGFVQNSENHPPLTSRNLPQLPQSLPSRPNTWAIHFRIGDYKILPHHQVPRLASYYYKVITEKIPKGSTIVLFSDSPEKLPPLAQEISQLGYPCEVFTSQDTIETFKAFAACQGGSIGGNSTFSWWCAFFGAQQSKFSPAYKAYFPDYWITNYPSPRIYGYPFTQTIELASIPEGAPKLHTFSYN